MTRMTLLTFVYYLIEDDDVSADLQKSFKELRRLMHGVVPANGEGPICASVRKMSKVQADHCAQLIVEIGCSAYLV